MSQGVLVGTVFCRSMNVQWFISYTSILQISPSIVYIVCIVYLSLYVLIVCLSLYVHIFLSLYVHICLSLYVHIVYQSIYHLLVALREPLIGT